MGALERRCDRQPMPRMVQITERDEGRPAISGVGGPIRRRSVRHARLAALEDFIRFDVTPGTVEIRTALNVVVCPAGAERAAQQHNRSKGGASGHFSRIRAAMAQS